MLEYICNMVIGLSDKQAEVIVAIIGLLSAMIVAGIGLFGSALTIMLHIYSNISSYLPLI